MDLARKYQSANRLVRIFKRQTTFWSIVKSALATSKMFGSREGGLDALLHREPPSLWSQFLADPVHFLARKLYAWRRWMPSDEPSSSVTVVCVSDTHNCQPTLPDGDVLIHAGDLTQSGSLREIQATLDWLDRQPHPHKVAIAGNHELILDSLFSQTHEDRWQDIRWGDVIYLENKSVVLRCSRHRRRIKVYGSPLTPRHGNWAFQYSRATDIWNAAIPDDTDILITHGPPKGHLDLDGFGCKFLLHELWRLPKKPLLHVFGHIHEGYGIEQAYFDDIQRAYDRVVSGGSFWQLFLLLYAFLSAITRAPNRPMTTTSSWLVDASMVGGLRDEKRQTPIIIRV